MTVWLSFTPEPGAVNGSHQVHAQHQGRAVLEMAFQALKKGCHSVLEKAVFNSL
jgi:hypothetical protein